MAQYLVDFNLNKAQISEIEGGNGVKALASVDILQQTGEVRLPLSYEVVRTDGSLVGRINSYMPEKERISFANEQINANLTKRSNDTFSLRAPGRVFDAKKMTLDELVIQPGELEVLKERGFQHRYTLKNTQEGVSVDFYKKDGQARAHLITGDSSYEAFLPLLLRDRILESTQDITVKEKDQRTIRSVKKTIKAQKETEFVKFGKKNYKENSSFRICVPHPELGFFSFLAFGRIS